MELSELNQMGLEAIETVKREHSTIGMIIDVIIIAMLRVFMKKSKTRNRKSCTDEDEV